jgi:hypothetical protein
MSEATTSTTMPSLDGCEFEMVSSTASVVSSTSPSRFRYRQSGSMVWGEYRGDTVTVGRFAGVRSGDTISIGFAHALVEGGDRLIGSASSEIARDDDGRILLIEVFEKDGARHESVCAQVDPADDWTLPAASDDELQLDGVSFDLEHSSASTVSATPTRFDFHERDGIVWGEYRGDTVTTGYSVGVRDGDALDEHFVHELVATGETLSGTSSTRVGVRPDGRLELVEEFVLDGVPGRSVCVQVPATS